MDHANKQELLGRFFGLFLLAFVVCLTAFAFLHFIKLLSHSFIVFDVSKQEQETMNNLKKSINIIFTALMLLSIGCSSTGSKKDKKYSLMNFHLEMPPDESGRTGYVPIYRAAPVQVCVAKEAFLDVGYIAQASVVEAIGGFSIRIQFNEIGAKRFQSITTQNRGRRIAIYSNFDDSRWLGAPTIDRTINDGVFFFTPDATREEADRIVEGINNVAEELAKPYVF